MSTAEIQPDATQSQNQWKRRHLLLPQHPEYRYLVSAPPPEQDGHLGYFDESMGEEGGDATDGSETKWLGVYEVERGTFEEKVTVRDVFKYVATFMNRLKSAQPHDDDQADDIDVGISEDELSNVIVLTKNGREIMDASFHGGRVFRPEVAIMLSQFLIFALLQNVQSHQNQDDLPDHVHAMFEKFGGHMGGLVEELTKFKECLSDDFIARFKGDQQPIKDLDTHLQALSAPSSTVTTKRLAAAWLKQHLAYLNQTCELANVALGYLKVYVRDRPGIPITQKITTGFAAILGRQVGGTDYPLTIHVNHGKSDLHLYGQQYGSYSGMFDRSTVGNANVSKRLAEDMKQLQLGYNVVIFGFGYSGSGKTYTLMGASDQPGAIALALAEYASGAASGAGYLTRIRLHEIFIETTQVMFSSPNMRIQGVKQVLYPESNETEIMFLDEVLKKGGRAVDHTLKIEESDAGVDVPQDSAETAINTFIRKIVTLVEDNHRLRLRMRPTPNNAVSSRVHTYFQFKLTFESSVSSSTSSSWDSMLTVIDMAGRESPEQLANDYGLIDVHDALTGVGDMVSSTTIKEIGKVGLLAVDPTLNEERAMNKKLGALKAGNQFLTVTDTLALLALSGTRKNLKQRKSDSDLFDDYQYIIRDGAFVLTDGRSSNNPFTFYKNDANFNAKRLSVYNAVGGDDVLKQYYGINAPLFYSNQNIAFTLFEGMQIGASLDAMIKFFRDRIGKVAPPTSKVIPTATYDILKSLDADKKTQFIMLAHVRVDRPEGLVKTLDFARDLSASIQ